MYSNKLIGIGIVLFLLVFYSWLRNTREVLPSSCPYVWHGGSSLFDGGSCWCGSDTFCECTPSLAIDVIIQVVPDLDTSIRSRSKLDVSVLLVYRRSPPQEMHAIPGGFVEIGETVETTAVREIKEELNLDLEQNQLSLFGLYSDPLRDKRRHTVSTVFLCTLSAVTHQKQLEQVKGGSDAKSIRRIPLNEVSGLSLAFDHSRILEDFQNTYYD